MWKVNVNDESKGVTACGKHVPPVVEGETQYLVPKEDCAWANVRPKDYLYDNIKGVLVEKEPEVLQKMADEAAMIVLQTQTKQVVLDLYEATCLVPVVTPYGTFNGGEGSAGAIQGSVTLDQNFSRPKARLTDINNEEVELNYGDAAMVAALVGKAAQDQHFVKQERKRFIRDVESYSELMEYKLMLEEEM